LSESEMRVGLHTAEFGSIAIRTSIAQQQMVARISLEHGDLGQAIAIHAPLVETKLGSEHGLHARIEVHEQAGMFSGDSQGSSQREQRTPAQSVWRGGASDAADIDTAEGVTMLSGLEMDYPRGYQLDVQA